MEKRNASLDVIKIIATTIIVFLHYQSETGTRFSNFINFYGGSIEWWRMVELFFIISGMLSYKTYGNKKALNSFFSFYKTKFVRLVPMVPISYIVFWTATLVYYILMHGQKFLGGGYPVGDVLSPWRLCLAFCGMESGWEFVQHKVLIPSWYISVLLLCYCIYYFLKWVTIKIDGNEDVLFILVILIAIAACETKAGMPFINVYSGRGLYCFFWGVIFCKYLYPVFHFDNLIRMICLLAFSAYGGAIYIWGSRFFNLYGNAYFLSFVIFPAIILLIKPLAGIKLYYIEALSKVSYEVFLFHFPFLAWWVDLSYFTDISIHSLSSMLIFAMIMWVIAFPLYFCEKKLKVIVSAWIERYFCKCE